MAETGERLRALRRFTAAAAVVGVIGAAAAAPSAGDEADLYDRNDLAPVWSPDGSRIAFVRAMDRGKVQLPWQGRQYASRPRIRIVSSRGGASRHIAYGTHPAWSPDGRRLIFSRCCWRLATANGDGSGVANLTAGTRLELQPAWSPDGRWIAFLRERGERQVAPIAVLADLYVMAADGSSERLVFPDVRTDDAPQWSPDGSRIAFIHDDKTWTVRQDGTEARALTRPGPMDSWPRWSPDGRRIAVVRSSWLTVMNADGSGARRLARAFFDASSEDPRQSSLSWSPDGRWIAFGHRERAYVIGANGRGLRLLVGARVQADPTWSRDGRWIAIAARGHCLYAGIHLVTRDAGTKRRLTTDCRILGTPRRDVIRGTDSHDQILGRGGNDRIDAKAHDDLVHGGPGADWIDGGNEGQISHQREWSEGEQLHGDSGNDVLVLRTRGGMAFGGLGADRLRGSRHIDYLYGGPGRDVVRGRGSSDRIFVRDGAPDLVVCGTGEDDRVTADREDRVSRDCEHVSRPS